MKIFHHTFQIICVLSVLSACALKDDFGRSKQSQVQADAIEAVGAIQEHTGLLSREAAFHIPYSGDEMTLRMTLKHFRKPFLAKPILRAPLNTQGITKKNVGENFQSTMISNIKSDISRINYFRRAVQRVIVQDRQRFEVISHRYDVNDNDSRYIRVRMRENRAVTMRVMQLLDKRTTSYDKAIEYAGLQYPRKTFQPILPVMDLLRTKISNLKSDYENYVYLEGADLEGANDEFSRRRSSNGAK